MAVFCHIRLVCLAMLMLARLEFADANLRVSALRARDLPGDAFGNKPDAYVKIWCGATSGGMTDFEKGNSNPSWTAEFNFPNAKVKDNLKLEVWDKDMIKDDKLGTCIKTIESGYKDCNCNLDKGGTLYFSYELK
ncbi:perforin-1-like [Myxocyprinus asiaticus]|uniref:perforin-1-like n=1 Tax=Myxocyprinus asiaticus TaxID=70543 RepID=UPI002221EF23|nr:perforin-1-like [Myxocyprinus asiaticus]